ncbi:hypothetical protein RDABS01_004537 [Bienertia sinuspersici]
MAGFFSLLRRTYLTLYNWIVCFGMVASVVLCCKDLERVQAMNMYTTPLRMSLLLAQTAAVLEIIHGLVGLVRSPVSATLPQIGSRLYVTWGILYSFPETRTHFLVSSLVISWAITEELFGSAPSWLQWLRYSSFMLFYPTGISSEVGLIYIALPYIMMSEYCLRMPNKWNFSFDYYYCALLILGIYVPGSPHMFTYMLGQRKKVLSRSKTD